MENKKVDYCAHIIPPVKVFGYARIVPPEEREKLRGKTKQMEAKELLVYRALENIQKVINEATMKDDSGFVKENLSDFADRVKIRLDGFVSDCYNANAQRALANDIIKDIDEHFKIHKNLPEAIVVKIRYIDEPGKESAGTILIDENKGNKDWDYIYNTSSKEIGELKEEIRELCSRLNHYTNWYIDDYCGMY